MLRWQQVVAVDFSCSKLFHLAWVFPLCSRVVCKWNSPLSNLATSYFWRQVAEGFKVLNNLSLWSCCSTMDSFGCLNVFTLNHLPPFLITKVLNFRWVLRRIVQPSMGRFLFSADAYHQLLFSYFSRFPRQISAQRLTKETCTNQNIFNILSC